MPKQALTDIAIRSVLPPAHGQIEVWDSRTSGFGLRVSHAGTKAFILVYRFNGRPRRLTLGRYPTITLSEARKLANEALHAVAFGTDPGTEKTRAQRVPDNQHFAQFVDHFIETYARPKNRSADESARLLRREFVRVWGQRPIMEITRHDVTAIIDVILQSGKHTTANRSLAAIRKLFNWAVERGYLDQSPCTGIRAPVKMVSRDRVLTNDEVVAVWRSTLAMGYPYGAIIQLLLLTGQRREEVAAMAWSELNLDEALWSIGAERTKSDRAHVVPLSPLAVSIIAALPRFHGEFVFPARGSERTVSGFGKWKREIDRLSDVSEWRVHDIRRTVATGMARVGVAPHVVERILNHTSGTFGGVAGVYNRFGYLPEMRAALERWATHVGSITGEGSIGSS